MTDSPIGRIYSIVEAAKLLGVSRSKLEQLVIDYPHYARNGNRKLFNDDDIRALWEAMRIKQKPSPFLEAVTGTSVIPTTLDSIYANHLKPKVRRQPRRRPTKSTSR